LLLVFVAFLLGFFDGSSSAFTIERQFYTTVGHAGTKELHEFPMPSDPPTKYLSIVVPAFYEQDRIERMLDETIAYLDKREQASKVYPTEHAGARENTH
jgi:dolichyl-phosphate beta-glucosyltransferase